MVLTFCLNGSSRNIFLKFNFSNRHYYLIRALENIIVGLPFILLLIVNGKLLIPVIIMIANGLLIFIKEGRKATYVLPTPFYKLPYEFIVGFRKTFLIILLSYFICGISITVGNFNLGVFSLIIIQIISFSFYLDPESHFYVWIYSMTFSQFLLNKVKILILYSTVLSLPIAIALGIAFSDQFLILIIVQIIGYVSIVSGLLSKYTYFPNRMPLPIFVLFIIALIFIPLVLVCMPYFYVKSRTSLKEILK